MTVDPAVTSQMWIYGGDSSNQITDHGTHGGDIIDGGDGTSNQIHGGYGVNSTEIVDNSDPTGGTALFFDNWLAYAVQ